MELSKPRYHLIQKNRRSVKGFIRTRLIVTIFVVLLHVTSAEGDDLYSIDAHTVKEVKMKKLFRISVLVTALIVLCSFDTPYHCSFSWG